MQKTFNHKSTYYLGASDKFILEKDSDKNLILHKKRTAEEFLTEITNPKTPSPKITETNNHPSKPQGLFSSLIQWGKSKFESIKNYLKPIVVGTAVISGGVFAYKLWQVKKNEKK